LIKKPSRPWRLERSGRFEKQKLNRKGAKNAKVIMLFLPGGLMDKERAMMKILNRH